MTSLAIITNYFVEVLHRNKYWEIYCLRLFERDPPSPIMWDVPNFSMPRLSHKNDPKYQLWKINTFWNRYSKTHKMLANIEPLE